MSDKCDIRILFDKIDRRFYGGETVTGEVHVTVNKELRCNGIVLTHYWKTHGRGNSESGERHKIQLSEQVPLSAGEVLVIPFQFVAEWQPLTYRGHLINVDHYVHVGVDLPWSFDPSSEEEYILLPRRPPEMTGSRGELVSFRKAPAEATGVVKFILMGVVIVAAIFLGPVAMLLSPLILLGIAAYAIRKKMITRRVGEVELRLPHVVVAPGELWPLDLNFTPQQSFEINGITLTLQAQESATSGSGTSKTTHRHVVHKHVETLEPRQQLTAGEPFHRHFEVTFPAVEFWSFTGTSNEVNWSAEVRIDIPRCPDWSVTTPLQLLPAEFVNALTSDSGTGAPADVTQRETPMATRTSAPVDSVRPVDVPDVQTHGYERSDRTETDIRHSEDGEDMSSLLQLVQQVSEAGRFGNERSQITQAAEGYIYDAEIIVDRISATLSFDGEDQRFRNGKTILGKIAGTNHEVQLITVEASNDSLAIISRGQSVRTMVSVAAWDSLYDRLVLHEVPFTD